MKHKSNRLFHGTKWFAFCAALILMTTTLCLPLQAAGPRGRNDRGIMGDLREGIRDFGRDVSDAIDPDGDGILPDGSIDNGIADDGSQNNPGTDGILPEVTTGETGNDTVPGTSAVTDTDPTPGTDDAVRTDDTTNGTTAPTTTSGTVTGEENTETKDDSGFRWTGLVITLIIIAAVVLIIILLIPKKKH